MSRYPLGIESALEYYGWAILLGLLFGAITV